MEPEYALMFVWTVWLAAWLAMAGWSNPTVKMPPRVQEWPYRLLQATGYGMLFVSFGQAQSDEPVRSMGTALLQTLLHPLWELSSVAVWTLAALTAVSLGFAGWARMHLGVLWSSTVTRKEQHRLIDTGPYAVVRHPIYAGLLVAAFALAAVSGTLLGTIGFGFVVAATLTKIRLEERFLGAELGAQLYEGYRAHVPMLIPWTRT